MLIIKINWSRRLCQSFLVKSNLLSVPCSKLIEVILNFLSYLQLETLNNEVDQTREAIRTKESEKEQIQRNLLAESRQLAALKAEMDQLRDRFKSQEDNHVAAVADLQKVHQGEVKTLKAELKSVQRGAPSGAEDALSANQQLAIQQVRWLFDHSNLSFQDLKCGTKWSHALSHDTDLSLSSDRRVA